MFNHFVKSSEWTQENRELFLHEIFQAYQQPNRFYHTLEHIAHCIQELQWLSANHEGINNTEQLFLALLAHDFIYNSDNKDISDECQSALWFETFLNKINYNKSHTDIIIKMIKATQHFNTEDLTQNDILNILCSIDLSILAQPAKIYKWYKDMVRQEYCFIPDSKFAIGRIKILQKLLSDNIYKSNLFAHYESRAKCNIEEELLLLQQL
jgi:predicted metal-dependent HD superfamily phosphohydrolase